MTSPRPADMHRSPPPIPTYLSHSYWPEDREINQYFHELCWRSGFALTVDPPPGPISTTRLEIMMRRSACFVGIVTSRSQPVYRCSPYSVYEYNLAVQARRPRLLLLERGVAGRYFPERHHAVVFDRNRLSASVAEIEDHLGRLAEESRPYTNLDSQVLGPVGLQLPHDPAHEEATAVIKAVLYDAGYAPVDLNLSDVDGATAVRQLDQLDFVVMEVNPAAQQADLIAFIQGRFVPSLKLVHHQPGRQAPPRIPPLLLDPAIEAASTAREVALWWSDTAGLRSELERRVTELTTPRRQFQSEQDGTSYFLGLGQTRGPVFVSNAGADNELARQVVEQLRAYGIRPFHYVYQNSIDLGTDWRSALPAKVSECQVFVPLISRTYWDSQYCREEFDAALKRHRQGKLVMIPCFLDESSAQDVEVQGIQLAGLGLTPADQTQRIVAQVDQKLLGDFSLSLPDSESAIAPGQSAPTWHDIAIITALREEYEAVYQQLTDPQRVTSTNELHNRYSWVTANVYSPGQGAYHVVLALAGTGSDAALLCARNTNDAFRPDSVLLVGVAGAVQEGIALGDVVVSERIFGYEYGKVDKGFHPRPDLSFPTDQSLASAARTLPIRVPGWAESVTVPAPLGEHREPTVSVGPVASGDKVVDDLADASFAPVLKLWPHLVAVEMEALGTVQAVEDARERGTISHFAMIRGISDRPVARPRPTEESTETLPKQTQPSRQTQQRDQWKRYAAAVAAAFTVELIRTSWPRPPRTLTTATEDADRPQWTSD